MKKHDYSLRERLTFGGENSPRYHEMKKGGAVMETCVMQRGSLVISGGAANGTQTGEAGSVLQRVDVDAIARAGSPFPGGKLKSVTPRSILRRAIFDNGVFVGDLSTYTWNGAAGTYTFKLPHWLRWALPRNKNYAETALISDQYDGLQMALITSGKATMFSGTDRTYDYSGVTFDIYDRREAGAPSSVGVLYENDVFVPIAGANARLPIDGQLSQNENHVDLLFITESTAAQTLVDTVINKITVSSGTDQFQELYPEMIKADQRDAYIRDAAQSDTGLYLINVAFDGLLTGVQRPISILADVSNPGGANLDRIIINSRRVLLPADYLKK